MPSPEFGEYDVLGRDLLIGANILAADAFLRSSIPLEAEVTYSTISFSKLYTPDLAIDLSIDSSDDGGYIITLSENPRVLDAEEDIFELGSLIAVKLQGDGSGLVPKENYHNDGMSLTEAAEHIIRRLPDFEGAAASIEITVPGAQ